MILVVRPTRSLRGTLTVPGDKSISHRAFLFASLAQGTTRILSPLNSDDVSRSRRAIESLGVAVREENGAVRVEGRGVEALRPPSAELDMGNSGTTTRLLLGILAGRPFSSTLIGDASLSRRPMRRVTEPLSRMGATFTGKEGVDRLPLIVRGGSLRGIRYEMPVPSAQVKSALLLAGLQAEGRTTVVESVPTRDHTERMLRYLGAKITVSAHPEQAVRPTTRSGRTGLVSARGELVEPRTESNVITIEPGLLTAREIRVPGDFSSAAFFLTAAAMVPGSAVTVRGVGLNPTRTALLDLLHRMGAKIEMTNEPSMLRQAQHERTPATVRPEPFGKLRAGSVEGRTEWEPLGDVTVSYASLKGITVEPEWVPNVIDELPVLMAAATQAEGVTRLDGVGELRVKETDRIRSMVTNLSALGARIREEQESVIIEGPTPLRGAEVDACGDHRTAMAMAVAGLVSSGSTTIRGSEWVRISFPEFAPMLDSLRRD